MNEESPSPVPVRLDYVDARTGRLVEADLIAETEDGTEVKLETAEGTLEVRLLRPGPAAAGHGVLDNEILAGLRIVRCLAGQPVPHELPELIGHHPAVATEPFALVRPLRGRPCGVEAGRLLPEDLSRFQAGLLMAVRLLTAAGVAHRALGPRTVRWDGDRVQVTGFAHAAVHGEPRTAVGASPWSAPEQRPEDVTGNVTDRDDLWAVGRLLVYMATGVEDGAPDAADLPPDVERVVAGVFAPPGDRPTVTEMLRRAGVADPVPYGPRPDPALVAGRHEFFRVREAKRPRTEHAHQADDSPEKPDKPDKPADVRETPATMPKRPAWPRRLARSRKIEPTPHLIWLGLSLIALLTLMVYLVLG